ncbi:MAG TPA: GNAT family N-acetyltransferase [Acetobacteraceae bacterium]|nr:GNAT family N-acetyltransferase [Acetobacteraceae bacterium]
MEDVTLHYEAFPAEAQVRFIEDSLVGHNFAATGIGEYFPVGLFLANARGECLGGLTGYTWGGWLHVKFLWIASVLRGQGHGTRLMDAAEAFAVEHGCPRATLETFSFQALGFYQKRGYEVFGKLDDYPPGHTKFYLRKALQERT